MSLYIIAEAGVNHNGSSELAHELIDVAADAGANAVKFQTFKASEMTTASTAKSKYQQENTSCVESQYQMLKRLELNEDLHFELHSHACDRNIDFMSTAFDFSSLEMLVHRLNLKTMKISSGELTNHPFIFEHARKGIKLILSTGMATVEEIRASLEVLSLGFLVADGGIPEPFDVACHDAYQSRDGQEILKKNVTLLHCTSDYPTKLGDVNLLAMLDLQERFGLAVGYSDHTLGVKMSSLSVAAGATILEKHFTLDKAMSGPDHAMSLCPGELNDYVAQAREAIQILGSREKTLTKGELENKLIGRKSIVALEVIRKGDVFTEANMGLKRCADVGLEPAKYWSLLGRQAANDLNPDAAITQSSVSSLQICRAEDYHE